jgi:peroxiredoxin Q/BCP
MRYGSALTIPFFGTFSNRQTYLIDPSGTLRFVFTDVDSRVKKHGSEVLAKISELTA